MSTYTALARKWRPRNFAEMTGQEHVLRALANALASGRVHHAFLFAGTRGVGKTTVARILAKCLNCERGVSPVPCGECASCREIDAGRSVDLIEVDAASRTRVDDTRELLDNVQYAPTRSRYKIYLIDEVHMLSAHSFNALLKTLEEPPPHVKFLLATTDPQKLPVTVLSRCLQFNLKRLAAGLIAARLKHILEAEQVRFEPAALQLVAQAGDGSLRDALSLLDQLLAYGNGSAGEVEAREMLGTVERDHVVRLAEGLAAADVRGLLQYAQELDEYAPDYGQLLEQLAGLLMRVALRQLVPDYDGDELHPPELLQRLAARLSGEDVQLYYQAAILGRRDLALAPDACTGFRMTLIRMLAFRPPGTVERGSATGSATSGVARGGVPRSTATPGPGPAAAARDGATMTAGGAMPAVEATPAVDATLAVEAAAAQAGPAVEAADASLTSHWRALLAAAELQGATRQLAQNCILLGREPGLLRLGLDPRSEALRTSTGESKLAQALSRHLGVATRIEIKVHQAMPDTPARLAERDAAQRQAQALQDFEREPIVSAIRERFDATVLPESVRPSKPA